MEEAAYETTPIATANGQINASWINAKENLRSAH